MLAARSFEIIRRIDNGIRNLLASPDFLKIAAIAIPSLSAIGLEIKSNSPYTWIRLPWASPSTFSLSQISS